MSMTSVPPFTEDLAESFTDAWSLSLSLSLFFIYDEKIGL